jgi:hypothetical protein
MRPGPLDRYNGRGARYEDYTMNDDDKTGTTEEVLAWYFGKWDTVGADVKLSGAGSHCVAFLRGLRDDMTPEVAPLVRVQFAVQETYRQILGAELTRATTKIMARARELVPDLFLPWDVAEAYHHGFLMGKHEAYGEASQAVTEAINAAWHRTGEIRAASSTATADGSDK